MKSYLRKISLEKRIKLCTDELSNKILANLFSLDEYKNANNIMCYYPLKFEVQIQACLYDNSKNWFLPRVNDKELEVCSYCESELKKGSFGILEPCGNKIDSFQNIDLIIIPAVAADINGYRIGYGKGYYDKFLSSVITAAKKIIPIYSDLLYSTIYPDKHDIKADIIVTEKEILKIYC